MLFGPRNSIVLVYDFLEESSLEAFEANLSETKKYYDFVLLSELIEKNEKGKAKGLCALCFTHPRKNFQLHALPLIQNLSLSCTVFMQPECMGTNRLPLFEEMQWLLKEHPTALSESQFRDWRSLFATNPDLAEARYDALRKELGVLPITKIGPESYYLTWGNLTDLNPQYFEWGIHLASQSPSWIQGSKAFAEQRLARPITVGFLPKETQLSSEEGKKMGFRGFVTERVGAVESRQNTFSLPQWKF